MSGARTERHETLIIGGGQAGLATGYHLARRGLPFTILDGSRRVGDSWRQRWDSLRLFTPARFNALPGMRFPSPPHYFPTKDEFADFLESYAAKFELPVRNGMRVDGLTRDGDRYVATAGDHTFVADNVIIAMANYQQPWRPAFGDELDPDIVQIHSADYRKPGQLQPGPVLIVGGGNSGSEIAMDLKGRHPILLSGRNVGQIPFRPRSRVGRVMVPVVLRFLFHHVLTLDTPIGRRARPEIVSKGGPLIRVKNRDLAAAGVQRVPRTGGVRDGRPVLEDGRVMDVANVVWCTGFRPGFESWIHLPIHGNGEARANGHGSGHAHGSDQANALSHEPRHVRGRLADFPGLYFVGLHFQRAVLGDDPRRGPRRRGDRANRRSRRPRPALHGRRHVRPAGPRGKLRVGAGGPRQSIG